MSLAFPVSVLPSSLRSIVVESAKSIGCDESFVALPVLVTAASAIGNTRTVQLKTGWIEPSVVWAGLVAPPGGAKSPALKEGVKPLIDHQAYVTTVATRLLRKQDQFASKLKSLGVSTANKSHREVHVRNTRFVVSDTTVAGLAELLAANPRGLLLVRDELSGWVENINKRTGGSLWLSMFDADSLVVDRKRDAIQVRRAAVSICGGIQPQVLRRQLLAQKHRESGLAARFLFACPEPRPVTWSEEVIRPEVIAKYASTIERLLELAPTVTASDAFEPIMLRLSTKAQQRFIEFFCDQGACQHRLSPDVAAAWPKLRAYAGRLALILELAAWADADLDDPPEVVGHTAIENAIGLVDYFATQAQKVYGMVADEEECVDVLAVVDLIERRGGSITPRELCQYSRRTPNVAAAEAQLRSLAQLGWGHFETVASPPGGRPSHRFVLNVYKTQ